MRLNSIISGVTSCLLFAAITFGAFSQPRKEESRNLFFVFNQPGYAPGDTAYFTGYLVPQGKKQIVGIKLFGLEQEVIHYSRIFFQHGVGHGQIIIPPELKPGHYQLVSYAETMAEGSPFFLGSLAISCTGNEGDTLDQPIKPDTSLIKITTQSDHYERRSQVSVSVNPQGLPAPALTDVTITVYNEKLFLNNGRALSTMVEMRQTQQESVGSGIPSVYAEFPDYFKGRATTADGQPVPDSSRITFYLSGDDFAYIAYTQKDGKFSFPLIKNFGDEQIFFRITHKGNVLKGSKIDLYEVPLPLTAITGSSSDTLNAYGRYALQRHFINRSYYYFSSREKSNNSKAGYETDSDADKEVWLDKYEPFNSMAEVFSNVVPSVRYRKNGNEESVRIFLERTAKYGTSDPVYLVNGQMTDDTKYILSLNPKYVRKIGVLRSANTLVRFGDLGLEGLLVIDADIPNPPGGSIQSGFSVTGISKPLEFTAIIHNRQEVNNRVPDLRSTLYWNPGATLNKEGTFDFFTGDDIGYYIIQVAGIAAGKPFLSMKRIYVSAGTD